MPKNKLIHNFLVKMIEESKNFIHYDRMINLEAVWIGMHDRDEEGEWVFVDGEPVNKPNKFPDFTLGGKIPMPFRNITIDGSKYWFFWKENHYCTYEECKQLCSEMDGTLANIVSDEINDHIRPEARQGWTRVAVQRYEWYFETPYKPGTYFINIKGNEFDRTEFIQGDGRRVYLYDRWYKRYGYPIPNEEDFAPFQYWDFWHDEPNGFDVGEHCVSLGKNQEWIDINCDYKLQLLCEIGPLEPFERWALKGTTVPEPNNLFDVENCGGYMATMKVMMWNDYDCVRENPFICEVDVECPWIHRESFSPETNFTCDWSSEGKPQCEFNCDKGYKLVPQTPIITCIDPDGDRIGEWSPAPPNCTLIENFCPSFDGLHPSAVSECNRGFVYQSECVFSCPSNMKLTTEVATIVCEDNGDSGNWNDEIPNCEDITCPALDTRVSGDTVISCSIRNVIDSTCTLSCLAGKRLSNGEDSTTVSCADADGDGFGDWDTTPPSCGDIYCPEIIVSSLDQMSFSCTNLNSFDSSCTFTCPSKMKLDSGSGTITCDDLNGDGIGDWSSDIPSCINISCPSLETTVDKDATLSCSNANVKDSTCSISCKEGKWLNNGDKTAIIACEDGDGDGIGDWNSTPPSCADITCPETSFTDLPSGTDVTCTNNNLFGSTCSFSCIHTKKLDSDSSEITCSDSDDNGTGEWSRAAPSCIDIECIEIDSFISEDTIFSCSNRNVLGTVCTLNCPAGKWLSDGKESTAVTCKDGDGDGVGEWDITPPTCGDVSCPEINSSSLASQTTFSCTNSGFFDSTCTFSCPNRMKLGTASATITCEDTDNDGIGEWSGEVPDCINVTCPVLDSLTNEDTAVICSDGNVKESACTVSCPRGKWLDNGDKTQSVSCKDNDGDGIGEWDTTVASCLNITCVAINSSKLAPGTEMSCTRANLFNSTCSFNCIQKKKLDSSLSVISCIDSDDDGIGEWTDVAPACIDVTCPSIAGTLSSNMVVSCVNGDVIDSVCSLSCPAGQRLDNGESSSEVTCEDSDGDGDGEWSFELPSCVEVLCSDLSEADDAIISCGNSNMLDSTCTLSCPDGMHLSNGEATVTVTCEDNDGDGIGDWNLTIPSCQRVTCSDLIYEDTNLEFSCTKEMRLGSTCTFRCPSTMKLVGGSKVAHCKDENYDGVGEWQVDAPTCVDVRCPELHSILPNNFTVTCTDENIIFSFCTMSCLQSQRLVAGGRVQVFSCNQFMSIGKGDWLPTPLKCVDVTCAAVNPDRLSEETMFNCTNSNIYGSQCSFSCPDGMKINGNHSVISCIDSDSNTIGEWNATIPDCIDVTCEAFDAASVGPYTVVNCSDSNVMSSQCMFSCMEGKKVEGDYSSVTCTDDDKDGFGEWDATFPRCIEITCPHLSSGNFSSSTLFNCSNDFGIGEQSYGAVCTFACLEGSMLKSKLVEESILCQDDDRDSQGEWNSTLPDCSEINCEGIDPSALGRTTFTCNHTNKLHSECTFQCPEGMQVPNAISKISCEDPDADGVGNWSSSVPVCYDVECPDIKRSMVNDETFFTCSDWKCSFYCDDGTTLVGGSNILTCSDPYGNKTGRWSHGVPQCQPINCTELDTTVVSPETSMTCTNSYHIGSQCTFTCPRGMVYQTESNVMKCQDLDDDGIGEWDFNTMPNCSHIFCSELNWKVIPKDLTVNCTSANYWGSRCQFECPDGEWMQGGITDMKCQDKDGDGAGEWSEAMPNCARIQCYPEYSFLQDGSVNCTDSNYYDSMCNFTCNYSYRLIGFNPAMCIDLDNDGIGEWNESFPFCEEYEIIIPSDCPEHAEPANGFVSCTDNGYIGSVCSYHCSEGYVLFGTEELECVEIDEDNAEWTDIYPICSIYLGECSPAYEDPLHGKMSCTGKHYVTSLCTFTCNNEYHVVGSDTVTCDDNDYDKLGDWSDPEPICFPDVVKCKATLESPENGALICTDQNIKNSVCTIECDVGYYVAGSSRLTCTDENNDGVGKWDSLMPTCETITCEQILPGSLTPETSYSCTNENIGNSECSFSCPDKFRLSKGVSTIYCEDVNESSVGEWSDEIPECLPIICEFDVDALDETTIYDCTSFDRLDSVCDFHCPDGMKLTTEHSQISCQDLDGDDFGTWDNEVPDCTPILCPEIDPGDLSPQTSFGCSKLNHGTSECNFECPVGWKLHNAVKQIVCEDKDGNGEGEWSDGIPSCIPIVCPEIVSFDLSPQTSFSCTDENLGNSVCSFSCPEHMRLDRDIDKITCVDKNGDGVGEWSFKIPYCVFTCRPDLDLPDKGKYTCNDLNRVGSQCDFECTSGFVLSHVDSVTCVENDDKTDGVWKGDVPTCDPFEYFCPEPETYHLSPETEYTCTKMNKRESRCTFSCPDGMELDTGRTLTECEDRNKDGIGEWNAKLPECIRTSCRIENTHVRHGESVCTESNAIRSFCSFECDSGFEPQPPYGIVCKDNGLWNSSTPSCVAIKCLPDLKDMFGSNANCLGGNEAGAECDVKCSHKSQKYGESMTFVCADPDVNDGAGFWDKDLLSCAGCASGLLDIIFLLDASANWEPWDFADMRDWLPSALYKIRGGINAGATWISVAVFGSREKGCNLAYTVPRFEIEMKLDFRNMESIRRRMGSVKLMGGCAHLGKGLNEAVNHLESRHRPHVTPMIILLLGGKSHDGVSQALTRVNTSDIAILGVANGENAIKFFHDNWISYFNVTTSESYKSITLPFLNALVKYDCKGHSLCSGPIENGTVTCIVKEESPAREVCTIHCDDDHQLIGEETALCGDINGDERMEWISPHGVCKKIHCPPISPVANTQMECSRDNLFSSVCRFWCNEGFSMVGVSEIICGDPDRNGVGEWHSRPPTCILGLACQPELKPPQFGSMSCSRNNLFGSECRFKCDDGYIPHGSAIVVCRDAQRNGHVSWDNPPPICTGCTREFCAKDVIFLLDGSGSINAEDFDFAKKWIADVLEEFQGEIDSGSTRVGVIQYSGESAFICASGSLNPKFSIDLELGRYPFRYVKETISRMFSLGGCTATGQAIAEATKHFKALGRENIDKLLIILTDGRSNDDVIEPAKEAELEGIKIIVVGIGSFNPDQLLTIGGRFVEASNYDQLSNVLEEVQEEIMSDYIDGHYGHGYCFKPGFAACALAMLLACWLR